MAGSPAHDDRALRITLRCDGRALTDTSGIVSVEVRRALNAVPSARLVLADGDVATQTWALSDGPDFKPGVALEVLAGYGDEESSIFSGVIVKVAIMVFGDNESRLVVDCRDRAVAMTLARRSENHVDRSDAQIIAALAKRAGLDCKVQGAQAKGTVVQYHCTDWDFMLARAEVNGCVVAVVDGQVTVGPPDTAASPVLAVTYGVDLLDFQAEVDARTQYTEVMAVGWDPKGQVVLHGQSATPVSLNAQGDLRAADLAAVGKAGTVHLRTGNALDTARLDAWSQAQQLKSGLARVRGRMRFQGDARALPGRLIEVRGLGSRYSGNAYVGAVQHTLRDGNWLCEVEFGLAPDWFVQRPDVAAPAAGGWLPPAAGLQIGKVIRLDGDPAGQQRIQVRLPVLEAQTEGVWARLLQFHASSGFGAWFVPEVDDEVVIAYLGDDPSAPVVLGSLYSAGRTPPYPLASGNPVKALVTRCGSRIELDETDKVVTIRTPASNTVVLSDHDRSILLKDQNGNRVELAEGGITLDSPKDITLSARGSISLKAVGSISAKATADASVQGMNVSCKADVGFSAQGSASAALQASGTTTVKGALVMIN